MNKRLFASLIALPLIATTWASVFLSGAATAPAAPQLPAGLAAPAKLPAIQDASLLEAWVRLHDRQDAIRLWDGSSLTGRRLADYLLDHGIPVAWDTGNVCGGGSCSIKHCNAGTCGYSAGQPIFVRIGERGDMPALMATLAHEIFHRMQPFGPVLDTRFEEYWAFRVEYGITPERWLTFGAYDPLEPEHLNLWLRDNGFEPYFQLPEYPASIEPLVNRVDAAHHGSFEGLPAAATGQGAAE